MSVASVRSADAPVRTADHLRAVQVLLRTVVGAGLALRMLPWLRPHVFLGMQEHDDGVYYGAARFTLAGSTPYRDFVFLHPPGIITLMLPFAAIGRHVGDPWGLALARLFMLGVYLAITAVIFRILTGAPLWGRSLSAAIPVRVAWAGVIGVAAYALNPAAVTAGHTVLLEPPATLAALAAVLLLQRGTAPAAFWAGAAMAAAVDVKLFALAYLAVLPLWLLSRRRFADLRGFGAGLGVGLAVLVLPFALADPGALWHDVVLTQLHRVPVPAPSGLERLADLLGAPGAIADAVVALVVATAAVVVAARRRRPGARSPEVPLYLALAALVLAGFLTAHTYYPHYGEFAAAPLALLAARAAQDVAGALAPRWRAATGLAVAVPALMVLAVTSTMQATALGPAPDLRAAGKLIPAGTCVYYASPSLAIAADRFSTPSATCPASLDARGTLYSATTNWPAGVPFYPLAFVSDERWQTTLAIQVQSAQCLLLEFAPTSMKEWAQAVRIYVVENFARVLRSDEGRYAYQLWCRA